MRFLNLFSKSLLITSLSVISVYALADQPDPANVCTKVSSFKGLIGSGTRSDPFQVPINKCLELNGNNGQEYVFRLDFTKAMAGNSKFLSFLARSFLADDGKDCNSSDRLTCTDSKHTPNLEVSPTPKSILYSIKNGFIASIISENPDFTTYTIKVSSEAAIVDVRFDAISSDQETNFSPLK